MPTIKHADAPTELELSLIRPSDEAPILESVALELSLGSALELRDFSGVLLGVVFGPAGADVLSEYLEAAEQLSEAAPDLEEARAELATEETAHEDTRAELERTDGAYYALSDAVAETRTELRKASSLLARLMSTRTLSEEYLSGDRAELSEALEDDLVASYARAAELLESAEKVAESALERPSDAIPSNPTSAESRGSARR